MAFSTTTTSWHRTRKDGGVAPFFGLLFGGRKETLAAAQWGLQDLEYAYQPATAGHEPVEFGQHGAWGLVAAHPVHKTSGVGGDAPGIDGISFAAAQAGGSINLH